MGTKTNPNEIGVMTIGTGFAGQTDAMIARDTMTEIQVTVAVEGTTGTTEVGIDETVGRGLGRREGHGPGIGIMEGGEGLGRERGMMVTPTSGDGQITEHGT